MMASKRQVFRAQLVMEDEASGVRQLRRSKRHGELVLDPSTQSAQMVYPRLRRFFQRKFEQPLKCVAGRRLLRVYSSNGSKKFTLVSEEDADKCAETLQSFGVQVIRVGEAMLTTWESRRNSAIHEDVLVAGCEAALRFIREASQDSTCVDIQEYEHSAQLQEDTETIMRAMFNAKP